MSAVEQIDSAAIRRAYGAILDGLPDQAAAEALGGRLAGDVRALLPTVAAQASRMEGEWRCAAIHVLAHAAHLVGQAPHGTPARPAYSPQDMAEAARALLALLDEGGRA
ncbi:hypothetical protein RKD23_000662 [Streptomyces sp. SAI-170]|uniref:DUF6415 family natural product biosynthesis protein n=1 Tax=Streptomyces sp. SAI-170 TaxID=3377729 RepID=UPI003C7CD685